MERIEFYRTKDPFGEFSNFAPFPIVIDGRVWPTSEHYFQGQKFAGTDPDHLEAIRLEASPMAAATMGRDRSKRLRPDWDQVKDSLMLQAVTAKFVQHATLRELLLSTGEALIVEHTKNDAYWGDGGDGNGLNKLGLTLMQVRARLRQSQSAQ